MKVTIARHTLADIDCGTETCDRCRFVNRDRGEPYICTFWNLGLTLLRKTPETIKRRAICRSAERIPSETVS